MPVHSIGRRPELPAARLAGADAREQPVEPDVDADPCPERYRLRREVDIAAHGDEFILIEEGQVYEEPLLLGLDQAQELEDYLVWR